MTPSAPSRKPWLHARRPDGSLPPWAVHLGTYPALSFVDEAGRLVFAEATERFVQGKRAWGIAPDHVNHLSGALKSIGFDAGSDSVCVTTTRKDIKANLPIQVSGSFLPASDGNWMRTLQASMQSVRV